MAAAEVTAGIAPLVEDVVKRRMGPKTAGTRTLLMDAAEAVMRENGYAAVTSRSVAAHAKLNQQTVYYYFETMDDLQLATYRRRLQKMEDVFEQAIKFKEPMRAFWDALREPSEAALTIEYLALSNHNDLIRQETIAAGERLRQRYQEGLREHIEAAIPDGVDPFAIIMALTYVAHLLGFEQALGLTGGHAEIAALADWCIAKLKPVSS